MAPSANGEANMKESKLIKIQEVLKRCAISRATLYRLIANKNFPNQVSVTGNRSVAWREEDIQRWIDERPTINQ
jgi:prophage regulatory protein